MNSVVLNHVILLTTSANPIDLAPSFLGREKKKRENTIEWKSCSPLLDCRSYLGAV